MALWPNRAASVPMAYASTGAWVPGGNDCCRALIASSRSSTDQPWETAKATSWVWSDHW